jgi:two-component system OmpR family response regulator
MGKNLSIAIIDNDPVMAEMVRGTIVKNIPSAEVAIYETGEKALKAIGEAPDAVILDYQLDAAKTDTMSGLQVLTKLREYYPQLPVIFISSQDNIDVATNTIKYGAHDYIVKNETAFHQLEIAINNIAHLNKLRKSHEFFRSMSTTAWILLLIAIAYVIYLRFS